MNYEGETRKKVDPSRRKVSRMVTVSALNLTLIFLRRGEATAGREVVGKGKLV